MARKQTHGIATRTLRATFWAYGAYAGGLVLSLLATAILARLLTPSEFGLVALALIAMAILDTFPGLGVGEALVVVGDDEVEDQAETAFAVSVVVGVVLAAMLALLGPITASFFDQPQLVEILPVLGLSFVFLGLASTHGALAQKRLDFRTRTVASLSEAIVRGVVSVVLAVTGAGVWSLVVGYVAGSAATAITLWLLVPWRPSLRPRRMHLRTLLRFGGTLTGVNVMAAFLTQFDFLLVGRVLGTAQLGFYSMATRLPGLVILGPAAVTGRVLFPAFVALQHDRMSNAFLTTVRYASLVVFPLAVFLGILAEPLTVELFGDQWKPAVPAVQVLCVWAAASTILYVTGNAFKARSRPDILFKLAVPQAVALVVGSLLVVHQGIVAVSWVQSGIAVCTVVISVSIAKALFGFAFRELLEALRPALLGTLALTVVLVVISMIVSSGWRPILAGGAIGAAVYLGIVALLAPDSLRALRAIASPRPTPRAGEP
jgi:PST family polysaccharide transporter